MKDSVSLPWRGCGQGRVVGPCILRAGVLIVLACLARQAAGAAFLGVTRNIAFADGTTFSGAVNIDGVTHFVDTDGILITTNYGAFTFPSPAGIDPPGYELILGSQNSIYTLNVSMAFSPSATVYGQSPSDGYSILPGTYSVGTTYSVTDNSTNQQLVFGSTQVGTISFGSSPEPASGLATFGAAAVMLSRKTRLRKPSPGPQA